MKKAQLKPQFFHEEYSSDIDRMIAVMASNNVDICRSDAAAVWRTYSDAMAASWMTLPEVDEDLYRTIRRYLVDEDGQPLE